MKKLKIIISLMLFGLIAFLFAQEEDQLIFSHKFHAEDAGASCSDCHAAAETSMQKTDNLLPSMETCYACHDEDETDCSYCHTNPDMAREEPRIVHYKAEFTHKVHVEAGQECLNCHQDINEEESAHQASHIPQSTLCTDCHGLADFMDESQQCYVCHSKEMNLVPVNHTVDWSKDHGISWQIQQNSCDHCHQNSYCINCHQGFNLDREVHPLNYRNTHGIDAKANKENCLTCHREFAFCNDCHRIEMVMPKNHSFAGWSNLTTGGLHAKQAQYDFDYCQSCHSDAATDVVCIRCHGN